MSCIPSLFIPRLLSPIHKGFFCTIVGLPRFELRPKASETCMLNHYTITQYIWNYSSMILVGRPRFELGCNHLLFQHLIRMRRYNPIYVGNVGFEPLPIAPNDVCYLFTPHSRNKMSGRQESNLLPSRLQNACPYIQQTPTRYKISFLILVLDILPNVT